MKSLQNSCQPCVRHFASSRVLLHSIRYSSSSFLNIISPPPLVPVVADLRFPSDCSKLTNADIIAIIEESIPQDILHAKTRGGAGTLTSSPAENVDCGVVLPKGSAASEVVTLNAAADVATYELVLSKKQDAIPSLKPSSDGRLPFSSSGGTFLPSHKLEEVHSALRRKMGEYFASNFQSCQDEQGDIPFVIGCDEAGRGPLAGPVVCAAFSRILLQRGTENELIAQTLKGYFPKSNTSSEGNPFVAEFIPAMDSKQVPEAVRRYSFNKLVANSQLLKEICAMKGKQMLTNTKTKSDDDDDNDKSGACSAEWTIHSLSNPTPRGELECPLPNHRLGTTTSHQHAQRMIRSDYRFTKLGNAMSLESILREAIKEDCPSFITTLPFVNVVQAPIDSPTIGTIRNAVKEYYSAVKTGEKSLAATLKKEAKAAAKAFKDEQKRLLKLERAAIKAAKKNQTISNASPAEPMNVEADTIITQPSSEPSCPEKSPPWDWQPNGLHPTLAALLPKDFESTSQKSRIYLQIGAVAIVNHQYIDGGNIAMASMHGMAAAAEAVTIEAKKAILEGTHRIKPSTALLDSLANPVILVDGSAVPVDLIKTIAMRGEKVSPSHQGVLQSQRLGTSRESTSLSSGCVIPLTKGDSTSYSIGAASTLAKVTRDAIMTFYGSLYPHYGFTENEGYPCPSHTNAIAVHGLCPIHRLSFAPCRSHLLGKSSVKDTDISNM